MAIVIVMTTAVNGWSEAGARGLAFLKVDVDSRAAGMGGAYTALTADASSVYWNPAGLASAHSASFILMHNEWLVDLTQEFGALHFKTGKHNLGIAFNILSVPDIEIRGNVPTQEPAGKFDSFNASLALSYATTYQKKWQLGVSLKYLMERYYEASAKGMALDLGVLHKAFFNENLDFGATLQNLGQMGKLDAEKTPLPVIFRTGLAWRTPLVKNLQTAVEVQHIFEETTHFRIGAEYVLKDILMLRGGFISGMENLSITAGLGFKYKDYHFDYAYVPYQYDLGDSHRLTFGIIF